MRLVRIEKPFRGNDDAKYVLIVIHGAVFSVSVSYPKKDFCFLCICLFGYMYGSGHTATSTDDDTSQPLLPRRKSWVRAWPRRQKIYLPLRRCVLRRQSIPCYWCPKLPIFPPTAFSPYLLENRSRFGGVPRARNKAIHFIPTMNLCRLTRLQVSLRCTQSCKCGGVGDYR